MPDEKTKRRIFGIHTSRMTLSDDVDLEDLIMSKDELSGADVKAICTEAGLLALRERRMKVTNEDFQQSKENVLYRKNENVPHGESYPNIVSLTTSQVISVLQVCICKFCVTTFNSTNRILNNSTA